ncbi:MAG: 2-oxoacid:acceptor oxidoreductase family protein [bacterium]|nr:MAG: 2-oxoacid:acceptor oxidoreductase family protein [bacterium]
MAFRYSIRFSGASGQGLILAARILAEAAAIYDDKNAAESSSYGPESRGNAVRAEIIISDEVIDYPKLQSLDFLMALTQEAYDKYIGDLKPDGTVVAEEHIQTGDEIGGRILYSVPFAEIAEKECQRPPMINIVALGFFAGVNEVVSESAIRQAILSRAPKMSDEIYMQVYEAGYREASRQRSREGNNP